MNEKRAKRRRRHWITVRVCEETDRKLRALADARGLDKSKLVRDAVGQLVGVSQSEPLFEQRPKVAA